MSCNIHPRSREPVKSAGALNLVSGATASKKAEVVWLQERHPDLLHRALTIERNAQAKLTSVKGLGRSFAWEAYLRRRQELPLLGDCGDAPDTSAGTDPQTTPPSPPNTTP